MICSIDLLVQLVNNNSELNIDWLNKIVPSLITGVFTILAAIITIIGVKKTIESNQELKNRELMNELDQKSEWRKELMNIAAKPVMRLEDVYRILASLRFIPKSKKEIDNSDQSDFDKISNYIFNTLNKIINKHLCGLDPNIVYSKKFLNRDLSIKESDTIRLCTKFLLKHHWEYNQSENDKEKFKIKELKEFKNVISEMNRLNKKASIKNDYYKTDEIHTGELEVYANSLNNDSQDK